MARLDSSLIGIRVTTTSATASFRDISQQVLEISGFMIETALQQVHAFGDAWKEEAFGGVRSVGDITLTGIYDDDTSTGVNGIFGVASDVGAERVIKLNFGTTNSYPKTDFLLRSFTKSPSVGQLTGFTAVLAPSGALTIVTT